MLDQPDQQTQGLQGKLILPAPPEQTHPAYPQTVPAWPDPQHSPMPSEQTQFASYPQYSPVPIEQTQYAYPQYGPSPASQTQYVYGQPPAVPQRRRFAWRKDPAYLVLSLAIALVVLAATVLVAFGATTVLNNNRSTYSQTPTAPTPSGTVDHNPAFGTPATGLGSNQSSQPPASPTPDLQVSPSPGDQQGALSVQIVQVPDVVANDSRVQVAVQTSAPGAQVRLQVSYNAFPYLYNSGTHTTDNNGQAIIPWTIRVSSFRNGPVQATVRAIATDQNGQQVNSQAVTVMVEG